MDFPPKANIWEDSSQRQLKSEKTILALVKLSEEVAFVAF